jgi:pimeloyl-ACP methyl ester carboxylesterase
MVRIGPARPNAPALLTIHGINDAPLSMQALGERGQQNGLEVHTLAYDDRFRRLRDTSGDLAGQLREWIEQNPGRPLHISAHSMGARIALGALSELQQQGQLDGRQLHLDLLGPPLGGFEAADLARLDLTGVLGATIPGLRPGHDMGSTSGFQERLESLRLPPTVSTRIFLGGRDRLVDPNSPGFQTIAANLNAAIVTLPEAAHGNLPEHVSRR